MSLVHWHSRNQILTTRTTTAMNDSDSDSSRGNSREEHNIDEESNTVRQNQKYIKTEQKTRILQCKKRKKIYAEALTMEQQYKTRKKEEPGNSGSLSD